MIFVKAFAVGGLFCAAAQILIDLTGLSPARILTGYVVAGVILSSLGIYAPIKEFAGCGATVPLTGFGFNIAEGTRDAVAQKGLLGALTGGISSSSAGIASALLFSLAFSAIFRGKPDI
ncbi:MAG: SpoVA/SpoVAEb family sporulation membrane protein [Clostridia bacterium]|nr:SpoVA/SpoVAEb family sporulation membrane protein [Clostridia bacterium]